MAMSENIKMIRQIFDVTQDELGEIAGVTGNAVSQWENERSEPRMGAIERMAAYFGLSKMNIIEDGGMKLIDPVTKKPRTTLLPRNARPAAGMAMGMAPRVGKVHAGVLEEPDVFDESTMVHIPQFLLDEDPESFVVSSEGDCMDRVFSVGSDLVVSKRKEPKDRSIVLASIDGADYIVRRLRLTASTMILSPESHNPDYEDIIITRDSERVAEIAGVVTWYQAPGEME